ncbi:SpaH/EbpB family LPXTG-anchored major pilin [Pseudoclavibacter soli]|uniref:SpaH/EbpB family LPXTG-anchored major pilin n=1 Tax=Pseudoclavibacter soli TaxID=452623 RepID=UPI0003F8547A|nr:SpaH/EbpB family LPXTG-anchored major pilin [Pseudoclavibacter soli]
MRSPHTLFSSAGASRTGAAAGRRPLGAVLAALTLLAALLVVLVPAVRADAVPAGPAVQPQAAIDPDATTSIQVHKFAQPEQLGEPSSGLEQDTTGLTPVAGATFTATKVPGIDTTTDAGRQAAADLSVAEAIAAIGSAAPAATETTDAAGDAPLTGLGVALYLVQETFTPTGYVASDPFLVLLPLTNPGTGDNWLYTVHVYPKNAHVTATIDVDDAAAVSAADAVRWTSHTTIPRRTSITAYVVRNLVDTRLTLLDAASDIQVSLECSGCDSGLDASDFTTSIVTYDGHETIEVVFSEAGRAKLATARAADPDAKIDVSYRTAVTAALANASGADPGVNGTFTNEVRLFPDSNTLAGRGTAASDATSTKFGPLEIIVHEKGNDANRIPGARFQLFLTAEDAANRTNPVTVWGVSEWTTDADGSIVIDGLRFSDFANGLDRDSSDPLYRTYYIRMIEVPAGWTGSTDPIGLVVNSSTEAQVALVELYRAEEGGSTGGLALTGGQIAGAWVLGAVLVVLGILALLARRRKREDSTADSATSTGDDPGAR